MSRRLLSQDTEALENNFVDFLVLWVVSTVMSFGVPEYSFTANPLLAGDNQSMKSKIYRFSLLISSAFRYDT